MIEALKNDELYKKAGGAFQLTALLQRRMVELLQGARPMVETKGLTDIEVVVQEFLEGKIAPMEGPVEQEGLEDEPV